MKHEKDKIKTSGATGEGDHGINCKHCGKLITKSRLIGLSLVCLFCRKPQNGNMSNHGQEHANDQADEQATDHKNESSQDKSLLLMA